MANDITVLGYGSLLSEVSARQTAKDLRNFRLVRVNGYKRIFNKVGIVFLKDHGASQSDVTIASCATRRDQATSLICAAFEVSERTFLSIYEREHRFRWVQVEHEYGQEKAVGRMCTEETDDNYRLNKCVTQSEYQRQVGRYYQGQIWRTDILPFPRYLQHCLRAAGGHGQHVLDNYLDTTFLADAKTSVRDYLNASPNMASEEQGEYSYVKPTRIIGTTSKRARPAGQRNTSVGRRPRKRPK